MGLIKITSDMTDSERTAVLNANLQYLQLSTRLRKYPIGMIVAFDTDIDPNELYGGTWERIKGAFIWGIDDGETAGTTGGEKTHTLTVDEMPAHAHTENGAVMVWNTTIGNVGADPSRKEMVAAGAVTPSVATSSIGGGQAHNNMPPYYGAYIWRKTAHGIGEDPTLTEYEAMMKQMNDALSETKMLCNLLFSNALRGSASGEAVRLTDVSPIEHTLTVKLKNKNLFDISSVVGFQTIRDLTYQSYYGSVSEDKTVTCRYGAYGQGLVLKDWSKYLKAGTYTISADCYYPTTANTVKYEITANLPQFGISSQNQSKTITPDTWTRLSFTVNVASEGNYYLLLQPVGNAGAFYPIDVKFKNIQLEQSSAATSYSPYIADFSSATLKRYGKNLVDISDGNSTASASTVDITESCPRGINIFGSAYMERSVNQPCRLRIDYVVDGETNYLFGEMMYSSGIGTVEGTIPASATQVNLTFQKLINGEGDIYWKNVQLEIGDSATDYRAFQQQNYIANADGTVPGVTSISDDITLMTDTDGVIINAEYNKDINKAFSALVQAIINLGGSV